MFCTTIINEDLSVHCFVKISQGKEMYNVNIISETEVHSSLMIEISFCYILEVVISRITICAESASEMAT